MDGMLDINQIRHRNVRLLIDRIAEENGMRGERSGALTFFANKIGKSAPQVTHFASDVPKKNIGTQIAREIEQALGLEPGWMDWAQWDVAPSEGIQYSANGESQSLRLDPAMIAETVRAIQIHEKRHHRHFSMDTDEGAALFMHWYAVRSELPDATRLENLMRLDGLRNQSKDQGAIQDGRKKGVSATSPHGGV